MSSLTIKEKNILEELLGMSSGYVLDFSNSSFARFIRDSIGLDIYNGKGYEEYTSKANKLRQIWDRESDKVVGKLIKDLIELYEEKRINQDAILSDNEINKISIIKRAAERLLDNQLEVELPNKQEETLQVLLDDINNALLRNKPELVLDRLHTFCTKLLREICENNGISIMDDKKKYYPLHSLVGMLKKYYKENNVFESDFVVFAIQNNILLFEKFNEIRNEKSYAHDNEVLERIEAEFVVKIMSNIIKFLDDIESYRKKHKADTNNDFDLPF